MKAGCQWAVHIRPHTVQSHKGQYGPCNWEGHFPAVGIVNGNNETGLIRKTCQGVRLTSRWRLGHGGARDTWDEIQSLLRLEVRLEWYNKRIRHLGDYELLSEGRCDFSVVLLCHCVMLSRQSCGPLKGWGWQTTAVLNVPLQLVSSHLQNTISFRTKLEGQKNKQTVHLVFKSSSEIGSAQRIPAVFCARHSEGMGVTERETGLPHQGRGNRTGVKEGAEQQVDTPVPGSTSGQVKRA